MIMHIITICESLRARDFHACQFFPILPRIFSTICQGVGCNALELLDAWMAGACFLSVILLIKSRCTMQSIFRADEQVGLLKESGEDKCLFKIVLTICCHTFSAEVMYVTGAWHIWHCIFLIMHKLLTVPMLCIMSICTVNENGRRPPCIRANYKATICSESRKNLKTVDNGINDHKPWVICDAGT
jgi:hypothetical protein